MNSSPQAMKEGMQRTRLRLHATNALSAVIVSAVVGAVVMALVWHEVPLRLQAAWVAGLVAALVLRTAVWRAHVHALKPEVDPGGAAVSTPAATVAVWLRRYRLAFIGQGVAWGLAAALMPPLMGVDGQTQLIFALATLAAGSLVTTAFDLRAAALFVVPALLPMVVHLFGRGDAQGGTQGALLLLFLVVTGAGALRSQRTVRTGVQLRLEQAHHAAAAERHTQEAEATRRALAEQHHLMAQLLRTTRQGYWRLDTAGVTVDVNPAMCVLLGRTREQIVGHSVFEFFTDEDRCVIEREIASRSTGVSGSYEVALMRPDGTRLHCMNQA